MPVDITLTATINISRRHALALLPAALSLSSPTFAQAPIYLADAHSHLGLVQRSLGRIDFNAEAAEANLALIAWTIVPDEHFIQPTASGVTQRLFPGQSEIEYQFHKHFEKVISYFSDKNLKLALTPSDIDAALTGKPHIVVASEGADFFNGNVAQVKALHNKGLRHLQLVHYIQSEIGDLQTIAPRHNGLPPLGQQLVKACNQIGILVDVSHCNPSSLSGALEISSKPVIWSHGWVSLDQGSHTDRVGAAARRIAISQAKHIASKGGVVGLWALGINNAVFLKRFPEYPIRPDISNQYRSYARGIFEMAQDIGVDHVCFGTDVEGLGNYGVVNNYRDLRKVAEELSSVGMKDEDIRKVCIGNYARVLKDAMAV
jgi:membrane dipeptidase